MTVSRESEPAGSPRAARDPRRARREPERRPAADAVRPLIAAHRRVFPGADADLLRRAYAVADRWHAGQTRKSGAPYITHPLAVAILLAEIGMDTTTLVAALLHDTVEDTGLTIGEVKAEFGAEVAVLVDGVTKLDGSRWGDHAEAETFRKMIVAASIDLRVLVIKLADRVHNLRTLAFHPKREKRERIARASMELLVPFAQRLGLYDYQREMEDLSFANLAPEKYERVRALVRATAPARDAALAGVVAGARAELAAVGLRAKVEVRGRHLFSIHRELPGSGRRRPAPRPARCGPPTPPGSSWWWTEARPTATSRSARCTAGGGRWRTGSATTSPCRSTTCTGRCTPPCWPARTTRRRRPRRGRRPGRRADPHPRDGPDRHLRGGRPHPRGGRQGRPGQRGHGPPGRPGLARPAARLAAPGGRRRLPRRAPRRPEPRRHRRLHPGRNAGQAPGRLHRRRFRLRGLPGDRGHRRRGARQRAGARRWRTGCRTARSST